MTILEAIHFFQQLGTSWYDQNLDHTLRSSERFAQFQEAENVICSPQAYRDLSLEQGYAVARAAIDLYDARQNNEDHIPHSILMQLYVCTFGNG